MALEHLLEKEYNKGTYEMDKQWCEKIDKRILELDNEYIDRIFSKLEDIYEFCDYDNYDKCPIELLNYILDYEEGEVVFQFSRYDELAKIRYSNYEGVL